MGNIILNLAPHSLSTVPEDVSTGKQRLYSIKPSLCPTKLGGCDFGSRAGSSKKPALRTFLHNDQIWSRWRKVTAQIL
jgi:hypothetical protein